MAEEKKLPLSSKTPEDDPVQETTINLSDPAARMSALIRLIATVEDRDEAILKQLAAAGLHAPLLNRLRNMRIGDVWQFVLGECGMSVRFNPREMSDHITRVERSRADRQMLEYMIRNGASPRLLTQLFGLSQNDARRIRKTISPDAAVGGRPKRPPEAMQDEIEATWTKIIHDVACPRERMRRLHQAYEHLLIASLELVVLPQQPSLIENLPPL